MKEAELASEARRYQGIDIRILFSYSQSMKITVEISDSEIKEICHFTGERKKGPAIRKLVVDALLLKRRAAMAENFISGKWGVELKGFDAATSAAGKKDAEKARRWRY
jgi:hypothetical protein